MAPAERTYLNFTTDSERWDRFPFREGDIVISTPPKAGTTLYLTIARDPRDVFVSYKHHRDNMDMDWMRARIDEAIGFDRVAAFAAPPADTIGELFDSFVDSTDPGTFVSVESLCHQMQLHWDRRERPNVCAQHFLDVKADPVAAMRRLATTLGLERTDERLAELAEAASIESMREKASERAPATGLFKDSTKFFRTGGSREWEGFATADQLARYWANVGALVDDDVSHWMHHGGEM